MCRPQFSTAVYRFQVAEDAPALTRLGSVLATDADASSNKAVVFSLGIVTCTSPVYVLRVTA